MCGVGRLFIIVLNGHTQRWSEKQAIKERGEKDNSLNMGLTLHIFIQSILEVRQLLPEVNLQMPD